MEKITLRALLYDFYGSLLTPKQQEIYDWYFQQDLSLGEIAREQGVSRPAIYDSVRRTEDTLQDYENKLGLVKKFQENKELLEEIQRETKRLKANHPHLDTERLEQLLKNLANSW